MSTAGLLLGDLSGFEKLKNHGSDLSEELRNFRREQFDEWSRDVQSLIDDHNQPLKLAICYISFLPSYRFTMVFTKILRFNLFSCLSCANLFFVCTMSIFLPNIC